jgi:hypothetical protein
VKGGVMAIIVLEKGETTFIIFHLSDHFQFFTISACHLPGEQLAIDICKVK